MVMVPEHFCLISERIPSWSSEDREVGLPYLLPSPHGVATPPLPHLQPLLLALSQGAPEKALGSGLANESSSPS